MRLLLLVGLFSAIFAVDLQVDYGVEQNARFAILTIKSPNAIPCAESSDINGNVILIQCTINKVPTKPQHRQKLEFFEIYSEVRNKQFHLFIKPTKKMRLFANAFDLKSDIALPKERPQTAQNWQIIGYENAIPFLSNQKYSGLNFPINIVDSAPFVIGELNIDASPLAFEEGADFSAFLALRNNFENKNYAEAINLADNITQNYAESIFSRDALLYKIRAMDKIDNPPDDVITLAKSWIKAFGADTNVPEVLYIIGSNYSKLRIYAEAKYYFNRILDEYESSKYAQYALVGLAQNLAQNGDKRQPPILYAKAYQNARDLDSASFVALAWVEFLLANDDKKNARNLISKVLNANPKYFLDDTKKSVKNFELWANYGFYDLSAMAGEFMLPNLENDAFKEHLMLQIAQWYESAKMPDDAYRVNSEFLKIFAESNQKDSVKTRADNLLFATNEGDKEKQIAQFDYIIQTYPNSQNAKLAYAKKAQNLFDLGRYAEVVAIKAHLDKDSDALKKSYAALIEREKLCEKIIPLWEQMPLVTKNAESVFECLFRAKAFTQARDLNAQMRDGDKAQWLHNEARVHFALGDFERSKSASRDAMSLAKNIQAKLKMGEILFFSQAQLNQKNDAKSTFNILQNLSPKNRALIPLYKEMLHFALNDNDNIAIEKYAKDLIALQKAHKTYEFSPFAELSYADVLFSDNRFSETLKVLSILHNANSAEAQKAHYLRGSAHYELGDNKSAKAEFEKCAKIKGEFEGVCKMALEKF
ncbi:DUF7494 domain-containing protein [Helicobacter sp. 23-1044]